VLRKETALSTLKETGIIAVIRAQTPENLVRTAEALSKGGVKFVEVTMTTPGALDTIRDAVDGLSDGAIIGAGTVLDAPTVRNAILAGAEFIVSPVYEPEVVEICRTYGKLVIPGAYTPTEILHAWRGGADIVKVFNAALGGADYIRDLKGPFPQIEMLPTGGVDLQTLPHFIRAGACAVAIGRALVDGKAVASGQYETITRSAEVFAEAFRKAKSGL